MATNLPGAKGLTLHTTYLQLSSLTFEIIDNGIYIFLTILIIILKFILSTQFSIIFLHILLNQ